VRQVLAASERAHRERLDRSRSERRRAGDRGTPLGRLGLDAEIAHLEAHLQWLEVCRRVLIEGPPAEATSAETTPRPSVDPRPPARARAAAAAPTRAPLAGAAASKGPA
jgi:hypothetical protein